MTVEIIDEFMDDKAYLNEFGLELVGTRIVNNEKIYLVRKRKSSLMDK